MSKGAIGIANDSRFAVQTKRLQGFVVLGALNTPQALVQDPGLYFQKLWIYPGASAANGIIVPNVGNVYVGDIGNQAAYLQVTLQIKAVANDRQSLLVTANATAHGFKTNDKVRIEGADDGAYNNEFKVTRVDANNFTFMLTDPPVNPVPGGTIFAIGTQLMVNQVMPDLLTPTDYPLKYELALGQKQPLASILVQGAIGDGVFYRVW